MNSPQQGGGTGGVFLCPVVRCCVALIQPENGRLIRKENGVGSWFFVEFVFCFKNQRFDFYFRLGTPLAISICGKSRFVAGKEESAPVREK
ncbi:hypothetical protein [Zoogloea sp.]|uniref:hypothetical protein n=1 Tax=Zoogloea sp. TaxID=49181 RepID=UPI0035B1406F